MIQFYAIGALVAALAVSGWLLKESYEERGELKAQAVELQQSLERQAKTIIEQNQRAAELDKINTELANRKTEIVEKTRIEVRYAKEVIAQDENALACSVQPLPADIIGMLNPAHRD
jgi:hypothetical protein